MQNPNDVKSQDDTRATQDKRSVEVLVHAVEKCERLQKQLDKAERILNELAIGHQSRNKYDELIRMGKAYFRELEK
jgi:hypothetical protein